MSRGPGQAAILQTLARKVSRRTVPWLEHLETIFSPAQHSCPDFLFVKTVLTLFPILQINTLCAHTGRCAHSLHSTGFVRKGLMVWMDGETLQTPALAIISIAQKVTKGSEESHYSSVFSPAFPQYI